MIIFLEVLILNQLTAYQKGAITDIDYSRVMRLHKKALTNRIETLPKETPLDVITKYHALADYHNHVVYSLIPLSQPLDDGRERPDPEVMAKILLANSRLFGNRPDKIHTTYPSLNINGSIRQATGDVDSFQGCEIDLVSTFKQIYTL